MNAFQQLFQQAIGFHQNGAFEQAEAIYRHLLQEDPHCAAVLHALGVLASQGGRLDEAARWLAQAVQMDQANAEYRLNLGKVYGLLNDDRQALACLREASRLAPDHLDVLNELGNVHRRLGNLSQAMEHYRRATVVQPNYAVAHYNLGITYHHAGDHQAAIDSLKVAVHHQPQWGVGYLALGNAFHDGGDCHQAVTAYRQAIALGIDTFAIHNNLGNALYQCGRLDEAANAYRDSLKRQYASAETHFNLGNVLHEQGKLDLACDAYRQAITLRPDFSAALTTLVQVKLAMGDWRGIGEEADTIFRLTSQMRVDDKGSLPSPFLFLCLPRPSTALQQQAVTEHWIQANVPSPLPNPSPSAKSSRPPHARLRVGYLSSDFCTHATAALVVEMLENHDRQHFEIIAYSYGTDDLSPMRRRIVASFDRFVELGKLSHADAAAIIRKDEVDLLVDLKGLTQFSRTEILAHRPAPIQINFLGYPGTMGARFMDYALVDEWIVPLEQQPFFTEKLVYLPGCYQPNDRRTEIASRVPSRQECGLPETGLVLCSFNQSYKFTPELFERWMAVMRRIPHSVLWLLRSNPWLPSNLQREAERRGVSADRLIFAERRPLAEHLARFSLADLFLDSFPVNAHTTASDALRVGVPLITLSGDTWISRVAGSLLNEVGMTKLVAHSLDEYESLVMRYGSDEVERMNLRRELGDNVRKSSLFDGEKFARKIESAYRAMWRIYQAGELPRFIPSTEIDG